MSFRARISDRSAGNERIWVWGVERKVWVEPVYDNWVDDCGILRRRQIRGGFFRVVQEPGRFEIVQRQVWVPASKVCGRSIYGPRVSSIRIGH